MVSPAVQVFEFGPYRIDSDERLLRRGEEIVALSPKVAVTLLVLVESAGRMVDKAELMKAVWPDTFVEEGALTRNISLLRKTLGDTGDEPVYIETIPKRGYRFVAPVRVVAAELHSLDEAQAVAGAGEVRTVSSNTTVKWMAISAVLLLIALAVFATYSGAGRRSVSPPALKQPSNALAVLPFRSVDNGPDQDYFAEGMTQALITGLAKLGDLRVISLADTSDQNESAAFRAILRDQSVGRVLTGTVQRSGARVRIDAQLMDPRTRAVLWANNYERDAKDVLTLESTVAEAIANEIHLTITAADRERLRERRNISPEALDAYLRGRYFWNRRTEGSLRKAVQYFQQAIAADPTYALAYSGLADSYSLLGSIEIDGMPPKQAMPLAKAAAQKAIEIDPDLGEGHVSLAYVELSYDWDLPGAAAEFSRALELNPKSATAHHWYSHYFMASGDLNNATTQMQEAIRLEPLSPSINIGIGWCFYYSKQYDKAIEQYRSATEMDPSFPLAHQTLGMAYHQKGMFAAAIEEFKRAAELSGNSPSSVAALASAYATEGKLPQARQELARLEAMSRSRYVPAFYFATIHYAMGDLAKTFAWGWKAVGERCDYLMYLRVEPRVGKLAGNPEFIKAMAALHR